MKRAALGFLATMGVVIASVVFDRLTGYDTSFESGWVGAWVYMLICYELVDKNASRET